MNHTFATHTNSGLTTLQFNTSPKKLVVYEIFVHRILVQ